MAELTWDAVLAKRETASTLTHALGLVLSLAGVVYLVPHLQQLDRGTAVACGIYLCTLVMVYLFSTLSHAVKHHRWRHWMRIWDQAWIYALISGTYTPFAWSYLTGNLKWILLGLLWLAALLGLVTKVLIQLRIRATTTYSYLLLGWLPSIPLMPHVPRSCLAWMAAGGAIYTLGTCFLRWDHRHVYFHAIWHLFVILASACHFAAIVWFVVQR